MAVGSVGLAAADVVEGSWWARPRRVEERCVGASRGADKRHGGAWSGVEERRVRCQWTRESTPSVRASVRTWGGGVEVDQ